MPRKAKKKVELMPPVSLTGSRNDLMLLAKERGIRNFRVLNKAELQLLFADGTTKEQIEEIVGGAVARWKAGWGSKKEPKS